MGMVPAAWRQEPVRGARRYLPILRWLPNYPRKALVFDLVAGVTLWGILVPEAMGYADIAGMPLEAGLYTLTASLLLYAILGTSHHLAVGATAASASITASIVAGTHPASTRRTMRRRSASSCSPRARCSCSSACCGSASSPCSSRAPS